MMTTNSRKEIVKHLDQYFQMGGFNPYGGCLVGIVFSRPQSKVFREGIQPSLEYLHLRSGQRAILYFGGYSAPSKGVSPTDATPNDWSFDAKEFVRFVSEMEHFTRWRYSGESDLILVSATKEVSDYLDFSRAVAVTLERLLRDSAISSIEAFLEELFRSANSADNSNITEIFSNSQGLKRAREALKEFALNALPESVSPEVRRAANFAVRNINR